MVRRILFLVLVCGFLACAQSAHAQGVWLGGIGFGSPAFYGGFAPVGFGSPVVARPVYVGGPVVSGGVARVYGARPAVQAPLNRASRRVWRRGW